VLKDSAKPAKEVHSALLSRAVSTALQFLMALVVILPESALAKQDMFSINFYPNAYVIKNQAMSSLS
jgi:hypothetical protein